MDAHGRSLKSDVSFAEVTDAKEKGLNIISENWNKLMGLTVDEMGPALDKIFADTDISMVDSSAWAKELTTNKDKVLFLGVVYLEKIYNLIKMIKYYRKYLINKDLSIIKHKEKEIQISMIKTKRSNYYGKPPIFIIRDAKNPLPSLIIADSVYKLVSILFNALITAFILLI